MKNSEKYKTPLKRVRAFYNYCYMHDNCESCELDKYTFLDRDAPHTARHCACAMHWLELEAEKKGKKENAKQG